MLNFDPTYLDLPEPLDPAKNPMNKIEAMKKFYPDASEAILENAPIARGKPFQINAFVDAVMQVTRSPGDFTWVSLYL